MSTTYYAPAGGGAVVGDTMDNTIIGSDFADHLDGGDGADVLVAGAGWDFLTGGYADAADDVLTGGAEGDDFQFGIDIWAGRGFGHDTITDFGEGDTLWVDGWGTGDLSTVLTVTGDTSVLTFGAGEVWESSLTLEGYVVPEWEIYPGSETLSLFGQDFNRAIDDHLIGTADMDYLDGAAGSDTIEGRAGNDVLYGGAGADTILGGRDNDVLEGGLGADTIRGNRGFDHLFGGEGDDLLFGDQRQDVLNGGTGNDILTGGRDQDTFVFEGDFGHDTITDLSASDTITLFGVTQADVQVTATAAGARLDVYGPGSQ
ncbi:MAG: calcium-binding protein, partial [Planctomycetota bacterium]